MSNSDSPPAASAAAVAGLASQVDELRRAVDPLRGLPGRVDELADLVARLGDDVAASLAHPAPVAAASWLDLPTDPDRARGLLEELTTWMAQVFLRYPDAAACLPECWLWHPEVIEELTWLMYAWYAAYQHSGASVQLAGDWHDRYRPGVVTRIKRSAGGCSLDAHTARDGERPGPPEVPLYAEAVEAIAAWWEQQRDLPAPEPTQAQHAAARRHDRGSRRR